MKRLFVSFPVLLVIVVFLSFSGCGEKAKFSSTGIQDLFSLIPENATGIFTMNVKKIIQLDLYKEKMEELKAGKGGKQEEFFREYKEFVEKTGIQPEKDLNLMVLAMFQSFTFKQEADKDFVAVINLKYNKEKILDFIREKDEKYTTENYQGQILYHFTSEKAGDLTVSFFKSDLVAFGKKGYVKQVVDLSKRKGKNVLGNSILKPLLGQLKTDSMVSFIFDFPENLKEAQPEGTPFTMDLKKAETLIGFFDHGNNSWNGEIKLISKDEESNKQIVNLLNGLKGMAALAGPEVSELVSNINLTSSADNIKLTFSLSDELLKKLQKKAEEKVTGFMQPGESK